MPSRKSGSPWANAGSRGRWQEAEDAAETQWNRERSTRTSWEPAKPPADPNEVAVCACARAIGACLARAPPGLCGASPCLKRGPPCSRAPGVEHVGAHAAVPFADRRHPNLQFAHPGPDGSHTPARRPPCTACELAPPPVFTQLSPTSWHGCACQALHVCVVCSNLCHMLCTHRGHIHAPTVCAERIA